VWLVKLFVLRMAELSLNLKHFNLSEFKERCFELKTSNSKAPEPTVRGGQASK